jgi:hypothetical protein
MSEVLEKFKDTLNEVYEIVKTVEVVTKQRRIIRVEILKNYTKGERSGGTSYIARYWEKLPIHLQPQFKDMGEFIDALILLQASYPWVDTVSSDAALSQALGFVVGIDK